MKLYSVAHSPYAARVRMMIRHKALDIVICEPPLTLRTPEFKAAYPLGKVPILDLMDGTTIAESTAIMKYLEALYPEEQMIPSEPLAMAQDEMMVRFVDSHLAAMQSPIFHEMFPLLKSGDAPIENLNRFDGVLVELEKFNRLLVSIADFRSRGLQIGDLCMVNNAYYLGVMSDFFGGGDLFAGLENVQAWFNWVREFDAVAEELAIVDSAYKAAVESFKSEQ